MNKDADIYKNVVSGNIIGKLYDNWLTSDFLNSSYRDYNSFHPSDLAACPRKSYRMSIKFPGEFYIIPKQQRTFENGHSTHARYQYHFGEMGILRGRWRCLTCNSIIGKECIHGIKKPNDCPVCHNPQKTKPVVDDEGNILQGPRVQFEYVELPVVDEELDIVGHTDGIVDLENRLFIIDFKTCSSMVFKNIVDMDKPIKYHVRQINTYMYILGIDYGCLLYENKNTLEIKEFYLRKDDDVVSEIKERAKQCLVARKTGIHPDIPDELKELDPYEKNVQLRYDSLSPTCKGYYGYPPCPFFYECHSEIYNGMGGPEKLYRYKEYDGTYKQFIKINKAVNFDD